MSYKDVVNERYLVSLASIKLVAEGGLLDLVTEDYEFLISTKPWIATDRSRARRCVEAAVYGSIDYLGLPRFSVPAEFIAGVIAFFVQPVNCLTACSIMDGAEWSTNIVTGVEQPVKANELFSHVLHVRGGLDETVEARFAQYKQKVRDGEI